jgi:hypothetical protein
VKVRLTSIFVAIAICSAPLLCLPAQSPASGQTPPTVTLLQKKATPFEVICAVARQARVPIGIAVGQDSRALFDVVHSYSIRDYTPKAALLEAIAGTGYSLKEEGPVLVLDAGDLTRRQQELLDHPYENFGSGSPQTMVMHIANLNMWLKSAVDEELGQSHGYGGSIMGSLDDEKFILSPAPSASTEEIANRIVSQGSKGMWILRTAPTTPPDSSTDEITVKPYQECSKGTKAGP